jgi:Flp pilus assembly pilin Flp
MCCFPRENGCGTEKRPAEQATQCCAAAAGKNMQNILDKLWREDDGVLSFEWALLTTLVVLGVVCGLAAARDAVIDELGDVAEGMLALDNSYTIDYPLQLAISDDGSTPVVVGKASDSGFFDVQVFRDCERTLREQAP